MEEQNREKLYPLMCRIFGHKFVSNDDVDKSSNEVVCSRCGERTVLPVREICRKVGHKWHFGSCQRCGEQKSELHCRHHFHVVSVFYRVNNSNLPVTFRQYKCCHCGASKADDESNYITGTWKVGADGNLQPTK